ncbi:hypothetical protein [Mucilaginibacter polytrichastri]|uniref:Viral A-type inclusion protein n=1 Tax=Mucilaginibacter polytrichastri TaxID=1302689 RepID=A0A1Q5ZVM4_9SPHI|nr:hypothetical protein [Mucilaginibacter polytrichastri]OKS85827.1 hypothetical protein RG47T_1273 [Mucilaginibacter polytrichastri]SFS61231.1 hypothetical protein SAMN04487890_102305 [Mucilaginibacter polytrichastri]
MKKIWLAAFACLTVVACSNDKAEEKKLMDDILATHDKVMAAEDKAMTNKIVIDSLLKINQFIPLDSAAQKAAFKTQSANLNAADEAMENWMHKFDPEYKGKSHADVMQYLNNQKKQIMQIDSQLNSSIAQSSQVLSKYKK